jgi:hypothetical protein
MFTKINFNDKVNYDEVDNLLDAPFLNVVVKVCVSI